MKRRTVRLTATKPLFIGHERDVDKEPDQKSVSVPAGVWRLVVAAAELGGFRPSKGHLPAGQCRAFASAVRTTLGAESTATRASNVQPADFVRQSLSTPANRRAVEKVLALIDEGFGISVTG